MARVKVIDPGCGHIRFIISHNGENREVLTTKAEVESFISDMDIVIDMILKNLGVFVRLAKKSGVSNWSDLKTLIEGKEFKV